RPWHVSFTFALAFLFWHRLWSGALLMAIAAAIAGGRLLPQRPWHVSFTFALAFLFWHRLWSGALLMAIAAAIA
ncbi:hypothetical protein C0U44_31930, partial [Klebsiella pneumoniae]